MRQLFSPLSVLAFNPIRLLTLLAATLAALSLPAFAQTDDHGDTAAAATTINLNTTTAGVLGTETDVDYFKFTLSAAARVVIYTTGTLDTLGSLRNSSDVEIANDDDGGPTRNFYLQQDLVAGTYYVRVSGYNGVTGGYSLRIDSPPVVDDFGDTVATAAVVALPSTTTAVLSSPTDVDYFSLTVSTAARISISTSGSVDTVGSLRNSSDVEIAANDDISTTNTNFRIVRDFPVGTYYIRVSGFERDLGSYSLRVEVAAPATLPTVATTAAAGITTTGATLGGNVTSDGDEPVTQRGIVFATTTAPLLGGSGVTALASGSGTGTFTVSSGTLTQNTHYYVRAYATNSVGTAYGTQIEFTTLSSGSSDDHGNTAATATAVGLSSTTAGVLNSASDIDYFRVTLTAANTRLIVYTTGATDTIGSLRNSSDGELALDDNSGTSPNFRIQRDLAAGTYYVSVIGASGATGGYSLVVETATPGTATVTTTAAATITNSSAILGGSVTADGGSAVTQRGIVYGTASNPVIANSSFVTLSSGSGTGGFTITVTGLKTGTLYFARAYAVNSAGTAYGPQIDFTTTGGTTPTTPLDDHGDTAATATLVAPTSNTRGAINSSIDADYFKFVLPVDSPVFIISVGTTDVLGSLRNSDDVEIASDDNSAGNGNFRFELTLPAGTYYLRVIGAFGSYIVGIQTTILATLPAVTTADATGVTPREATLGGNVTNAGGVVVTQRGVVFGTTPDPVLGNAAFTTVNSGTGAGAFTVSSGALQPNTRYYARAFAINSVGTVYGSQVEFVTQEDDHGDTAAGATPATANTTLSGVINRAGDVDYFRFVLPGAFHVLMVSSGNVDTAGSLRGSTDQEIASDDNGGANGNFRIERDLAAGTYYLRVSGSGGATGAYSLRIETSTAPTVASAPAAAITATTAALGGTISSDGGAAVTQRGVVVGLLANPTVAAGTVFTSGEGTGSFVATVGPLLPETEYHARAFAVNAAGTSYGEDVAFATPPGSRLVNLSIRSQAGDGAASLIVGFALSGAGSKPLLLRAVGPGLTRFGVTGTLDDPFLQLASPQTAIASNENWDGSAAVVAATTAVGAFPLTAGSRDAVLLQALASNTYTMRVGGGTGIALAEIYDTAPSAFPKLVNVSTRAPVGTGSNILIAGFTLVGPLSKTVLIRAIGPTLATFQVTGAIADPKLDVFASGSATALASNDNWGGTAALSTAFERVGAFALGVASRDAAALLTLSAGSYTVQVSGVGNATGIALLEIYEVP